MASRSSALDLGGPAAGQRSQTPGAIAPARAEGPFPRRRGVPRRAAPRPCLHDLADLGPGQPGRGPPRRRNRRPWRRPVQRRPLADLPRPPRPCDRPVRRRRRLDPRHDRRQVARRQDDRGRAGRAYAIARGVPEDAILVEDRGRTTLESLRTVGAMLPRAGPRHGGLRLGSGPTCFASCASPGTRASRPSARRRGRARSIPAPRNGSAPRSTRSARWALYFLAGTGP